MAKFAFILDDSVTRPARRLFAFDLDGTLLGPDSQVSMRTLAALDAADQAGHTSVAVTGRSWRTCTERLKPIGSIKHIVCSNGAYCFNQNEGRVAWGSPLSVAVVTELAGRIRQSSKLAGLGWESATGIGYDEQFIASSPEPDALERGGSADLLGQQPLYKLYIRTPGLVRGELPLALLKLMGELAELTTSGASFVEATAQGVNKASGLAALAKELNFSAADTIAFGDNLNDLPMLNWAGTSVAMANAHPDVLATTAIKTSSNVQDGVAMKIEQMLAGR